MENNLQRKFYRKEMEVNALLEITQAVNDNMPEEDLYKIYEFTLRANLQLSKMVLYVKDEDWGCKVQFGTSKNFNEIPLDAGCLNLRITCFQIVCQTPNNLKSKRSINHVKQ